MKTIESNDILTGERQDDGRYTINFLHNNPLKRAIWAEIQHTKLRNQLDDYTYREGSNETPDNIDIVPGLADTMARLVTDLEGYAFLPFKDTIGLGEPTPTPLTLREMEQQFSLKIAVANRFYGEDEARARGREAYLKAVDSMVALNMPIQMPNAQRTSGLIMPYIHRVSDHQHNVPPELDIELQKGPIFNVFNAQLLRAMADIHTPPPYEITY